MSSTESNEKEEKKQKSPVRDFMDSLVIAFVIAMIIRTFFIGAYKIPSGSMLDTLQIGDHLLASKISYILGKPHFGDIAVFEYPLEPDKNFIKRVIGEPGDKIKVVDKKVYRNGVALVEPYVSVERLRFNPDKVANNIDEFIVPEKMYMMMGDNRDGSFDGRYWGFVPEKAFRGKSLIIYWSKEPGGKILWDRILKLTK